MTQSLKRFFVTYFRIIGLAYRIHPGLLVLLTVTNLGWGLTNLPILYINKTLIDLVIASVGRPDWQVITKSVVLLVLVRTLIEFVRMLLNQINNQMSYSMGDLMTNRIVSILGKKLNSLDVVTVEEPAFQDKYDKISSQSNNRIWGMLAALQEIPNALTTIISGIIPIFSFNPLISLLVVLVGIPDAIASAKLTRFTYQKREIRSRLYRVLGWLSWFISNPREAFYDNKIAGNVNYVADKMHDLQDDIFKNEQELRLKRVQWRTLTYIPDAILSFCLNVYFFVLAIMGRITLGTAQMLYQSANTLSNGMSQLLNNIASIYENYLYVSDFTWFMNLKSQISTGNKPFPTKIRKGIDFEDVWFKYPHSEQWVLKGVSLHIGPQENVALVGENGAGKSTLFKLLFGFYKPDKGEIKIDGKNIFDYDQASYWKNISALSQEFHLYPFTAKESIAFTDLSRIADITSIRKAASHAQIDEYLYGLPKHYDTPLSKDLDGVDPSGGQKQRIGIARTLFKKSQIVILDEPTSNVDPKAEEEIFENIISVTKNKLLILISHRFSTVRRADKILVLDKGKITEQGSHEELMKQQGKYSHLFNLQAKNYQ